MKSFLYYVPILLALAVFAVRLSEIFAKRTTVAGKVQENLTFRLFLLVGTLMTFGSILEYCLSSRPIWWVVVAAGVLCAIISFKLRWAAIAALGRFWSLHVEMREDHEFVQSGPFRFMRHPTYFSMILELLGTALILQSWATLVVVALIFIPTMWWRLRIEERALVEKFGAAYVEYSTTTPILVPWTKLAH